MLVFHTESEIPVEAFRLMGASTKANDNSKIGFFGTGLKYGIAVFFREGIEFGAVVGGKPVEFTLEKATLAGQEFDEVLINGIHTSYTTRMGEQWSIWQAVREIWQNTVDEGGTILFNQDELPTTGSSFWIDETKIQELIDTWDQYFSDAEFVGVRRMGILAPARAYWKGMRVTAPDSYRQTLFSVHFKVSVALNEMRVIHDYSLERRIYESFSQYTKEDWEWFFMHPQRDQSYEWNILSEKADIPYSCKPFSEALTLYRIYPPEWRDIVYQYPTPIRFGFDAYLRVMQEYPHLDFATQAGTYNTVDCKECMTRLSGTVQRVHELTGLELPMRIEVADYFSEYTLGSENNGTIAVAHRVLHNPEYRGEILPTVLEEMVHLTTGYEDNDREMQEYLFRTISRYIAAGIQIPE